MKTPVEEAEIEDILFDICNYEDMDSMLCINITKSGGAFVMTYDGALQVSADTLREALIKIGKRIREDIEPVWFDEDALLDWS